MEGTALFEGFSNWKKPCIWAHSSAPLEFDTSDFKSLVSTIPPRRHIQNAVTVPFSGEGVKQKPPFLLFPLVCGVRI